MKVVIVNAFDTYEHRVELLYRYFKMHDCDVQVYVSDFQHIKKEYRNVKQKDYTFIHAEAYYKNLSVSRLQSHKKFSERVYQRIKDQDIDLLWVLIPPNSLTSMAAQYKQYHTGTKVVLDMIDLWPETMPIHKFKNIPPLLWWKNMRDKNLEYADLIVTECALYQERINPFVRKPEMKTLYLAWPYHKKSLPVLNLDNVLRLCYLGSINNIIDIPTIGNMINVIKERWDLKIEVHIIGDGEKREKYISELRKVGAKVIFYGKVYDEEKKKKIMDGCHLGINIMKESVCVGLTMKSMDYLENGLPILNNIKGDTWKLVEQKKIGINIDQLKNYTYNDVKKIVKNRAYIREVAEQLFSYEAFEKRMDQIISDMIS